MISLIFCIKLSTKIRFSRGKTLTPLLKWRRCVKGIFVVCLMENFSHCAVIVELRSSFPFAGRISVHSEPAVVNNLIGISVPLDQSTLKRPGFLSLLLLHCVSSCSIYSKTRTLMQSAHVSPKFGCYYILSSTKASFSV